MTQIQYRNDKKISPEEFIELLKKSTLAERRPVDDLECIEGMLGQCDLLVTAWDGEKLVGVSRSATDFHYACYLSDLAVDSNYQRQGIGKKLIALTQSCLGPKCNLILLAAPAAADYYGHIGFEQHNSCWLLRPCDSVK